MALLRIVERDRRDRLGEGPLWSACDDALYWTDILDGRINRLSLTDAAVTSRQLGGYVGWVIERERGGMVAGVDRSVVVLSDDGAIEAVLADLPDEADSNRVNDAKADRHGRIWFGSMPVACDRPSGSFYRLNVDGTVARIATGYTIANGPAIGRDDGWLLHTDTALRTIFRLPVHDDGGVGPRTPFIVFEDSWGNPDGMTFDADGGLWVACWGAGCVTRFAPDGRRDRSIALPATQITSCAFAGPALDRMFVTSAAHGADEPHAGALFEVNPGCRGLAPHLFRG